MGFAINLSSEPPTGRAFIELALALDPARFELHHVRALRRGIADYLGTHPSEIRVLSITRWKPVVQLELPAGDAERVVRAFESQDPALRRSLQPLTLTSARLDASEATITAPREATARSSAPARRR